MLGLGFGLGVEVYIVGKCTKNYVKDPPLSFEVTIVKNLDLSMTTNQKANEVEERRVLWLSLKVGHMFQSTVMLQYCVTRITSDGAKKWSSSWGSNRQFFRLRYLSTITPVYHTPTEL